MKDDISVFKGIAANPIQVTTWAETLNNIKSEKYKKAINIARSLTDPEEYRKYKQTLPAVTFCGTFKDWRKKQNIESATGFIIPDLDHIQDVEKTFQLLQQDQNVWFAFRSPSGTGLKAGLRAEGINDDEDIKVFFDAIETYFLELYGIKIDSTCKDICRLTFVSYDPQLWVNPSPVLFDVESWSRKADNPMPVYDAALYSGNGAGKERYARKVLESSCEKIAQSTPGNQHYTRLKMARLLGGFSHYLDLSEIMAALEQAVRASGAKNISHAMQTIKDGLEYGAGQPIFIPDISDSISSSTGISYISSLPVNARVAKGMPELINFSGEHRDGSLFKLANYLVKAGATNGEIQEYLKLAALKWCDPPFEEKDIQVKIQSALNREERTDKALAEEVREWCCRQPGVIMSSDVAKELGLSSRVVMKNLSKILSRLCDEQVIEKYGNKRGCYRVPDKSICVQEWWNDEGTPLNVKFPLGIEYFTKVFPGNIILVEGEKSQGKSTFALEFCRMNRDLFPGKIMYQNVEMADSELLDRFRAYGDVMTVAQWREAVVFIKQRQDWQDHISPDGLNVVDYLIEYNEPYKLPNIIFEIHKKIKKGIALLLIQRDPFKPYGTGGSRIRDIPRVCLSLMKHKCRIEDVKSFYPTEYGNPKGLVRAYKHVSWWELRPDGSWEFEEEAKYESLKFRK